MCGICGLVDASSLPSSPVESMLEALVHRGPDEGGAAGFEDSIQTIDPAEEKTAESAEAPVWLGSRRLRVLDTTAAGRQPLSSDDGDLWIVHNGEIYNAPELRSRLEAKGHTFETDTDTEVLLHLYDELGPEMVRELQGMFAFAILDRRRGELHLFRDRLGIKPLYLYEDEGGLAFASEVRALLASGRVPRHLDPGGLYTYLAFGSVQEPLTLVEGVRSLPPGHRLKVPLNGEADAGEPEAYWSLDSIPDEQRPPDAPKIRSALDDAVSSRLLSDVPLGAFLSGGMDSGAIVGLMSQSDEDDERRAVHARKPRTFTLTFEEDAFDESAKARRTAQLHDTDHEEVQVPARAVVDNLDQIIAAMDQPSQDGPNTWLVSRAARKAGLTVALSGLGGDELFAGYDTFTQVPKLRRLEQAAQSASPIARGAARLLDAAPGDSDRRHKLASLLRQQTPLQHPYFLHRAVFTPDRCDDLLSDPQAARSRAKPWIARGDESTNAACQRDEVNEISQLELEHYLLSTLLRDTDQMSMAHALEVRVPFLDHRLVETLLEIRGDAKLRSGVQKPLLAEALGDLLPEGIETETKDTFTLPWERWMRGELADEIESTLADPPETLERHLDPEALERVWDDFRQGRTNWARPWTLYVLCRWVELNLENWDTPPPGRENA